VEGHASVPLEIISDWKRDDSEGGVGGLCARCGRSRVQDDAVSGDWTVEGPRLVALFAFFPSFFERQLVEHHPAHYCAVYDCKRR